MTTYQCGIIRSVEGRVLPNIGEIAVYWPNVDCTNFYSDTFDVESKRTIREGELWGGEYVFPEIIHY